MRIPLHFIFTAIIPTDINFYQFRLIILQYLPMHPFNIKSLLGLPDDDGSRRSTSPGSTIQLSDDDSRAPSPTGTITLSSDDEDGETEIVVVDEVGKV